MPMVKKSIKVEVEELSRANVGGGPENQGSSLVMIHNKT